VDKCSAHSDDAEEEGCERYEPEAELLDKKAGRDIGELHTETSLT
jgi:hypothetical protein